MSNPMAALVAATAIVNKQKILPLCAGLNHQNEDERVL